MPQVAPRSPIADWLDKLPNDGGFAHISADRRYMHDEAGYDAQYGSDPANLTVGRGVVTMLREAGCDTSHAALEIGCGTGLVSAGLADAHAFPLTILTDPSPAFLRITQKKVRSHGTDESDVRYAVLMAEEIDRLPAASFSTIILRSTLHHVSDVAKFLADCSRALVRGGILTVQEPCQEGYVLMGALAQFLPALADRAGQPLTQEQATTVRQFCNTMRFYARRDVDKSKAEDKHLFRVDEIMAICDREGMSVEFRPNVTFDRYDAPADKRIPPDTFIPFFRDYARYCMSWNEGLMQVFEKHMVPYAAYLDSIKGPGGGPYMHGVFLCRKR